MEPRILDALLEEYRRSIANDGIDGASEMDRFLEFLTRHAGMRQLEAPGKAPRLLATAADLRCFHYSQYLEWYLPEKVGMSSKDRQRAREALRRFNEWLLEARQISREAFEENRESIQGEVDPPAYEDLTSAREDPDEPTDEFQVREEQDFYVPGEYTATLSGEFVITKVQEGILYGRRDGDPEEVGPILVDRAVSSGHKVGDLVHLSLGRAGGHWNLLGLGRVGR